MNSIFALEHFENYDMFENWAILVNQGFHGQNRNFVNFMMNYVKYAYLGLIGTIENENK